MARLGRSQGVSEKAVMPQIWCRLLECDVERKGCLRSFTLSAQALSRRRKANMTHPMHPCDSSAIQTVWCHHHILSVAKCRRWSTCLLLQFTLGNSLHSATLKHLTSRKAYKPVLLTWIDEVSRACMLCRAYSHILSSMGPMGPSIRAEVLGPIRRCVNLFDFSWKSTAWLSVLTT